MNVLHPDSIRVPTEGRQTPCLLGSRCDKCATVVFPQMPVCPACLANGAMQTVEIGRTAKLFSHTIARFAPKGFKAPFFQIFVDLPEGPRIFSLSVPSARSSRVCWRTAWTCGWCWSRLPTRPRITVC